MNSAILPWQVWALLSAAFAALTAIFGKVGVEAINSDVATLFLDERLTATNRPGVAPVAAGALLVSTKR